MMIFYAGAFTYIGRLHSTDSTSGCTFDEPLPIGSLGVSTAVSIQSVMCKPKSVRDGAVRSGLTHEYFIKKRSQIIIEADPS
jgi:hypothetical protein